jgi:hypothetical protein
MINNLTDNVHLIGTGANKQVVLDDGIIDRKGISGKQSRRMRRKKEREAKKEKERLLQWISFVKKEVRKKVNKK